jgi:hypothetical protein
VLQGHRYYDPSTGTWLTRDPIGYAGGINLYAFCGNNPVNFADPWGFARIPRNGDWDANAAEASSVIPWHYLNPVWFRSQVTGGGIWDFKNHDGWEFRNYANMHYGYVGTACGFSECVFRWMATTDFGLSRPPISAKPTTHFGEADHPFRRSRPPISVMPTTL